LLEKHIQLQSPSRVEELVKIFIHALKVCGSLCDVPCADGLVDGDWFLGDVPSEISRVKEKGHLIGDRSSRERMNSVKLQILEVDHTVVSQDNLNSTSKFSTTHRLLHCNYNNSIIRLYI
jgi:hypothetical protein